MDKKVREKYKKILLEEKEKVLNEINNLAAENLSSTQRDLSGDLSGYSMHMADVGTDNYQRELALGLVSNEQQLLHQIDKALQAIEDRSYGKCKECSKLISASRLKALPFAEFCIKCQEEQERSGEK